MNYYNEHDPKAAAWLRVLIQENLISKGEVDERDIQDVRADELAGYRQCHFFAGIGGWSLALRLAGIPDDEPVWTASCPCQPFSVGATNQAQGASDERDLWPIQFELIRQRTPPIVFGEQVRNAISWGWWDRAKMGFESISYAAAAAVMRGEPHGVKHQRKRLYFVAHAGSQGRQGCISGGIISRCKAAAHTLYGDPIAQSGRALGDDCGDLRPSHGLSVQVVRDAIKGFGNAIVPQVAAAFIESYYETLNL